MKNRDMYNTFDEVDFCYGYDPCQCTANKGLTTYDMDFGDTAIFPFYIDEDWHDSYIYIEVYNFRYELIYQPDVQVVDEEGMVFLAIDQVSSMDVFKPGIYYVKVQAVRALNDGSPTEQCTLLSPTDCSIHVR